MNEAIYSVVVNEWFKCAITLSLRWVLPGIAWSWLFPEADPAPGGKLYLWVIKAAKAMVMGVAMCVVSVIVLAELGMYSVTAEWLTLGALIAIGTILGLARSASGFRDHILLCLPGLLLFVVGTAAAMNLPRRGEMVLGGLDPGVYQNQGVYVAQTGTFYPKPRYSHATLEEEGLRQFTRGDYDYREYLPGIPIDSENRTVSHYFFRATPSLIAASARSGGLRSATRTNLLAGIIVLIVFAGFLIESKLSLSHVIFSVVILAMQPIWLYHLHVPTTEMLQLLLVCGMGLFMPSRKNSFAATVGFSLLFLAALLNRFSFMPFGCILIAGIAWLDRERKDRARVFLERSFMVLGLALGAWFDFYVCWVTIQRLLGRPLIMMGVVSCMGVASALIIDVLSGITSFRKAIKELPAWLPISVVAGVLLFLVTGWFDLWSRAFPELSGNLRGIVPYIGEWFVCAALAGSVLYAVSRRHRSGDMGVFLLFLVAASTVVLINHFTSGAYPWLTRRHLAYTVPLVSILAAFPASWLWGISGRYRAGFRVIALVMMLGLIFATAKKSWHAWHRTEYDGVSELLARISDEIDRDDIVVVDEPEWGTPLAFIYDKDILNGKKLWENKRWTSVPAAMNALQSIRQKGRRIRFLTTTRTLGIKIYPLKEDAFTLDWQTDETGFDVINHGKRADDFELHKRKSVFRLYTWCGLP